MQDIITDFITKIVDNLSEDMRIALIVGCELEHEYNRELGTYKLKTKYPIGIVRETDRITVYENRGGLQPELKQILMK